MLRGVILYYLTLIVISHCEAQNLVRNGDLENFSSCPTSISQWYLLDNCENPNSATPDLFSYCCTNSPFCTVPSNFSGDQIPNNFNSYVGAFLYSNNYFEYISLELEHSLEINKYYIVSFYVSLGDNYKYAIHSIGAYLHSSSISQGTTDFLNFDPQILNTDTNFLSDKGGWTLISGIYLPSGGEKYITIGNFNSTDSTDTLATNTLPTNSTTNIGASYYYIDAVSVVAIEDSIINSLLYPNPGTGSFTLKYNLNTANNGVFNIYNELGQIIFQYYLNQNNGILNFDLKISSGMYFWQLKSESEIIIKDKLIIQH